MKRGDLVSRNEIGTAGGVCLLRCSVSAVHEPAQSATVLGCFAELASETDRLRKQDAA